MAKKLTNKQMDAVRRVASNLGISDQLVGTIVSEYLGEQSNGKPPKRNSKPAKDTGKTTIVTDKGTGTVKK